VRIGADAIVAAGSAVSRDVSDGELRLVRGEGAAALVATHNERLAAKMDRVVRLHEGRLQD
jgi:lipoprotein-releasing system ATP-binding protein